MMRNKHYRIFVDPANVYNTAGTTFQNFIQSSAISPYTLALFNAGTNTTIAMSTLTVANFPSNGVYFAFKLDPNVNKDTPFVRSPDIIYPDRIKYSESSPGSQGNMPQFIVYDAQASPLNAYCLKLSVFPDDAWITYDVKPVTKTWCGSDACFAECDPCKPVPCYRGMFELWKAFLKEEPNTSVHAEIGTYSGTTFTSLGGPTSNPNTVWSTILGLVSSNPNYCPALRITLDPYTLTTDWCQVFEYPLNPYYLAVLSGQYSLSTPCGAKIIQTPPPFSRSRNTGWEIAYLELGDVQYYNEFYTIEAITDFINPRIKQRADRYALYDVWSVVYNPLDAGFSDVTLYVAGKKPTPTTSPAYAGILTNVFNVFNQLARREFANSR